MIYGTCLGCGHPCEDPFCERCNEIVQKAMDLKLASPWMRLAVWFGVFAVTAVVLYVAGWWAGR